MRDMCYTESVRDQARGVKRRRWRIRWWAARADRRADGRRGHWRIVPVSNGCEPGPVPVVVANRTAQDNTRAVLTPPGRFGGRARPSGNPGLLQREAAPSNGGGFVYGACSLRFRRRFSAAISARSITCVRFSPVSVARYSRAARARADGRMFNWRVLVIETHQLSVYHPVVPVAGVRQPRPPRGVPNTLYPDRVGRNILQPLDRYEKSVCPMRPVTDFIHVHHALRSNQYLHCIADCIAAPPLFVGVWRYAVFEPGYARLTSPRGWFSLTTMRVWPNSACRC